MACIEGRVRFLVSVQSPVVEWRVTREMERFMMSIVSRLETVMFLYVWDWFRSRRANTGGAALHAWAMSRSTSSPAIPRLAHILWNLLTREVSGVPVRDCKTSLLLFIPSSLLSFFNAPFAWCTDLYISSLYHPAFKCMGKKACFSPGFRMRGGNQRIVISQEEVHH